MRGAARETFVLISPSRPLIIPSASSYDTTTGSIYAGIIDAIPDVHLQTVRRFNSGDVVVDESVLTGHVHGEWAGVDGGGAPVRVRVLHVFDIRDGLIARENTWFDASAVLRQVEEFKARQEPAGQPVETSRSQSPR